MSMAIILAQIIFTILMYALGILVLGLAIFPSFYLVCEVWLALSNIALWKAVLMISFSLAAGYFLFGFVLMVLVSILRLALGLKLKEGTYAMSSLMMIKWMFVNALFLVVKVTFMDFLLLTPFCGLFYKMMGARLGKGVQINSKNVADLSLLEIGDYAVIGGNATVIAHSFEKSGLVLRKVKIGKGAIIGLNSVILPGSVIGDKAVVAAGAIVPKGTIIEASQTYYGIQKG